MSALVARLSTMPRDRLIIGGLTVLIVATIVTLFLLESRWGYSGRVVKVVFVNSWPADRSVADVYADRQKERQAALAAAAESRAYIATLPPGQRERAQAQYDAYIAAQPKMLQPDGFKPAPVPVPKG